jgi:hypothetical protein
MPVMHARRSRISSLFAITHAPFAGSNNGRYTSSGSSG